MFFSSPQKHLDGQCSVGNFWSFFLGPTAALQRNSGCSTGSASNLWKFPPPKKLTGASGFEGELGNWNVFLMAHNSWPVAHLSFYLGQHFGNPYFKWTDLVVKIDHQKRGSPKKNTCATKTAKNQERRRLFVLRKKTWFHQSWIHPKIIQAWHHSYINFSHSVFCLQISIFFVYPVSIHLPITVFDSNLISWHTPGTFQPFPTPIPAHLMEPCFLSPDSVQLWSCVTLLATSLPKETYVTTGAWQGRSYPFW